MKHPLLSTLVSALTGFLSAPAWCASHLDLDVAVDPVQRTLNATVSITVETHALSFQLARDYIVEAVEVDGATFPTEHDNAGELQRFHLDLPDAAGARIVSVRYHGELKPMNTAMTHDDTLAMLPAISSTAGAFLPGSSIWHPLPEESFTYRLTVRVPAAYVAVAPGAPVDERTADKERSASFVMDTPVDSIDLMIGPWKVNERVAAIGTAQVRIRTYFGDKEVELAQSYLDAAERFINRYAQQIGAYPFPVFSIVASPIPTGFGMPTLTYLGKDVLAYPFIRDVSLGHEVLHNWWGGAIRVDPRRGNWAEGLTTFMADYAFSEDESADAAMRMRHRWLRDYAALPPGSEQALSAFRTRHHTASATIGYGKSAMMFHALRKRLGADVFAKGIRLFWQTHRNSVAGFDELRAAFEAASGSSLAEFFDQWLDRTGAPNLTLADVRTRGNGKQRLMFELRQDSGPFDLQVPLLLIGDKGQELRTVASAAAEKDFTLETAQAVRAIEIDPQFELWRRLAPGEAPPILRDIVAADTVRVLVLDEELSKFALEFSNALTDGKTVKVQTDAAADVSPPLIVVGQRKTLKAWLERSSLGAPPEQIKGSALAAWMVQDNSRKILAVMVKTDAGKQRAPSAHGFRLRHLGSFSWVGITTDGASERGNWPISTPRIKVPKQ